MSSICWRTQGHKVGLIGTNQNLIGSEVIETERTTPESYELHALFARMRDAGCTHVIMEVSSHSLVLDRVHGIRFAVGAFTNLTQDHLDFHKTMENYRQAKAILFTVSDRGVINLDDAAADKMLADAKCPCLTYSCGNEKAGLCATNLQLHADGVEFDARYNGETAHVRLPIPGHFSVENALDALGVVALRSDMPLADAAKSMATATGVKGRVEVVPTDTDYTVLIDYAHSPDGVENVLKAVRGFAKGRVVALFGCGGDRDRTKRPKMGRIAADACGLLHRHERQSAHRGAEGHHRRHPRGHEGQQDPDAGHRRPPGGHSLGARACTEGRHHRPHGQGP